MEKQKFIKTPTPKGVFIIPLKAVAENRASEYEMRGSEDWNEEVEYVMDDSFEGIDWLLNNTEYEDWESIAKKHSDEILVTDEDFWTSSDDFEIIEL